MKLATISILALAGAALASPILLNNNLLKVTSRGAGETKDVVHTEGKPLTTGADDSQDNQKKAAEDAIKLLKEFKDCIPAGDPTATPPVPPYGGAPGSATPAGNLDKLKDRLDDCKIGHDKDLSKRPGKSGASTANAAPGGDGTFMDGDREVTVENSDGMNISKFPDVWMPGDNGLSEEQLDDSKVMGKAPGEGSCYYISNEMLDLMLDIMHENTHLEDPRDLRDLDEKEVEGPVYEAEIKFLCKLIDCIDGGTGSTGMPDGVAFFQPKDRSIKRMCDKIAQANKNRKDLGLPQIPCDKCPDLGQVPCPETGPDTDGHPDNNEESLPESAGGGSYCGWNNPLRTGYFHLESARQGNSDELIAVVDQINNQVQVELTGISWGDDFETVTNCDLINVSPTDGHFVAVSVTATSTHSIIIGGYASLSGKGVFVAIRYAAGTVFSTGGGSSTVVEQKVPDIIYTGCDYTYPIALNHNDNDNLVYFFDRDKQVIGAVHLASGAIFELANADEHPELQGTLYLMVGRYKTEQDGLSGALLSASRYPVQRDIMLADSTNPIFHMADTDRDYRLEKFWLQD